MEQLLNQAATHTAQANTPCVALQKLREVSGVMRFALRVWVRAVIQATRCAVTARLPNRHGVTCRACDMADMMLPASINLGVVLCAECAGSTWLYHATNSDSCLEQVSTAQWVFIYPRSTAALVFSGSLALCIGAAGQVTYPGHKCVERRAAAMDGSAREHSRECALASALRFGGPGSQAVGV